MEIFSPFEGSDMAFPVLLRAHTCFTAFYSLIFVGCAAASAKAAPKAVSSSIPAAQRLQMGGSSSSSSGLRTSAGGTVRVGPPLTAAPAQIRSEKLQSGWAARFWEHNPGIFLFWLPKLFG